MIIQLFTIGFDPSLMNIPSIPFDAIVVEDMVGPAPST
jgi:hypothetical protein